jgi:hypothetical protein
VGPRVGLHGCGKSRPHRSSIIIRQILRRQNLCKSVKLKKYNVNNNFYYYELFTISSIRKDFVLPEFDLMTAVHTSLRGKLNFIFAFFFYIPWPTAPNGPGPPRY